MIHNLRVILLTVTAMLALNGVAATSSQAEPLFHSELNETTLTAKTDGTSNTKQARQELDVAGATLKCAGFSGHGTVYYSTVTEVTLEIAHETPCTFVGQAATVEMRGCDYTMTSHGTVSITDTTGKSCAAEPIKISVSSPPCVVTIGSTGNQNLESLTFKNIGSGTGGEITVETHLTQIVYKAEGSGCLETGTKNNGNYTRGNFLITGEVPGTATMVGIWWE